MFIPDKIDPPKKEEIDKDEASGVQLPDGLYLTNGDISRLEALNKAPYVHTLIGGKNLVLGTKICQVQGLIPTFESPAEFYKKFSHHQLAGYTKAQNKRKNIGKAWFEWEGKKFKPGGTGFYPDPAKCPKEVFNFWSGYQVKPKKGDCTIYLDHLKQIICRNDEITFHYLIGWMAHIIQKPDVKSSVAILLKSVEGVGKGTLAEPLIRILGPHGTATNGAYAIAGRFNSTIANRLFIFVDEADLTDKHVADRLKAIISEPRVNLERKGLEIESLPNFCRLMFASNHEKVLNAGIRERRYLVLDPDDRLAQDTEYFKKLWSWINDENGPAKFLHYLQNYDISGFNPYKAPQTSALIEEKLANLHGAPKWVYEQITCKEPFSGRTRIPASVLVDEFRRWTIENDVPLSLPAARSQMGKMLQKLGIPRHGRNDRGEGIFYEMPDSVQVVQQFCKFLDIPESALHRDFF